MASVAGLSAASHLGWWVRKRLVGYTCCMSLCRCRPVLVGQTVSNGANSGVGPPTGVMWQLRWARVWGCEGGGAPHTHPFVPAQVWVSWHRGKMKGGLEVKGAKGATHHAEGARPGRRPRRPRRCSPSHWRAGGEGGGAGGSREGARGERMPTCPDPQPHSSTPHTPVEAVTPLCSIYGRAACICGCLLSAPGAAAGAPG